MNAATSDSSPSEVVPENRSPGILSALRAG